MGRLAPLPANALDLHGRSAALMEPGVLMDPADSRWPGFAQSWEDLPRDEWMADGGLYRRRRYAAFDLVDGKCERLPHCPHFQERDDNWLNGGFERWFAPMQDQVAGSPIFLQILQTMVGWVERSTGKSDAHWRAEAHQFRIEAAPGQPGKPTPEGMHRDGRDWVIILLIGGTHLSGGETRIENRSGELLLRHRLTSPGEALLLDDQQVRHETSAIEAIDGMPAWRDTLVLTLASVPAPDDECEAKGTFVYAVP